MDILSPYIVVDLNTDYKEILNYYLKKTEELEEQKEKALLDYHLSLFKNIKFRKDTLNRYMENINDLCCDIFMINIIKQEYNRIKDRGTKFIEVAIEDYNSANLKHNYEIIKNSKREKMRYSPSYRRGKFY